MRYNYCNITLQYVIDFIYQKQQNINNKKNQSFHFDFQLYFIHYLYIKFKLNYWKELFRESSMQQALLWQQLAKFQITVQIER